MKAGTTWWGRLDRRSRRQLAGALALPGLAACGVAVAARLHPEFGRFLLETAGLALGVASTPVIFESLLFLVGMAIVFAAGILRGRIEQREWEEAHDRVSDVECVAPHSLEESVTQGLSLAVAEGCLEIGAVEEAWEALLQVPRAEWHEKPVALVRLRVAEKLRRWTDGESALVDLGDDSAFDEAVARYRIAHAKVLMEGVETGEAAHPKEAFRKARSLVAAAIRRWPGASELARREVGPGAMPRGME